jgi:predicted DNA-binding transcriptional regulator AlpA
LRFVYIDFLHKLDISGPTVDDQDLPEPLLTDRDLEAETGVPRRTWGQYRYLGTGPRFIKLNGHVRYRRADFEAWLDEHTVTPGGPNEAA